MPAVQRGCAGSTAVRYSSGAVLRRNIESPDAARTCSTPVGDGLARGSGRRGRRFKSCYPDRYSHRGLQSASCFPEPSLLRALWHLGGTLAVVSGGRWLGLINDQRGRACTLWRMRPDGHSAATPGADHPQDEPRQPWPFLALVLGGLSVVVIALSAWLALRPGAETAQSGLVLWFNHPPAALRCDLRRSEPTTSAGAVSRGVGSAPGLGPARRRRDCPPTRTPPHLGHRTHAQRAHRAGHEADGEAAASAVDDSRPGHA